MKRLYVLIGILTLTIFIGCIPQETKDQINKVDEQSIQQGNRTNGTEMQILDGNYYITPKNGWLIKRAMGPTADFIIKRNDRESTLTICMYSNDGKQKIFNNKIDVSESLENGVKYFTKNNINSSEPEEIMIEIDGIASLGYLFSFKDNRSGKNITAILFIYSTEKDLIEISFKTNEEDIEPLRKDILNTISTLTFK